MTKEKPIVMMTSAECAAELARIDARTRELTERDDATEPPPPARPAPLGAAGTGWQPPDPLQGAGAEYRRIALHGTPAELVALEREREEIAAELRQLFFRGEALRNRQRVAQEDERKAAAPGRVKQLQRDLPKRMERAEKAIAEARAALDELHAWMRDAHAQRELAGDESPMMDVQTFRRLGLILNHRVHEQKVFRLESVHAPAIEFPALFGSYDEARHAMKLVPAERSLLDRLMQRFFGKRRTHLLVHEERDVHAELERERLRIIAGGDFEQLQHVGEAIERRTIRNPYPAA